ncbi:outer membrane beta-barrel protein [Shewanella sp. C32]|uniref:Outer membrane beta-barrel protein n=1 Tax=Shewanella electrica TaxID=515560 RepID=A0ABT2FF47_9GAMM|nr:outer membrane beta-barrel protein [Shewanella electrica]MCH1925005.1 outer membrane beta-barrel protein [Shewanella electrica]MCS4554829.1 outer membrane beta-barrel protein [Shewanella electrica]
MKPIFVVALLMTSSAAMADDHPYFTVTSGYSSSETHHGIEVAPYFEVGVGGGYQFDVNEDWRQSVELGIKTSQRTFKGFGDSQVNTLYANTELEYQGLSDNVKPFVSLALEHNHPTDDDVNSFNNIRGC